MSGINSLLDIGRSALQAYQRALTVTGQNISNVNTPGYSRQDVVLSERAPQDEGTFLTGTGVEVAQIRRSFDAFIEGQLTTSQQRLGRQQVLKDTLSLTQGFFQDSDGEGLSAGLNDFFNAIQDVATNPSDVTSRSVLLSRAQTLAARFNATAANLQAQRRSLDGQITQTVDDVNHLASQVADLNGKIAQLEMGGQTASELRDQRASLLNELAQRIDTTALEDGSGQVTVYVGRGQTLVTGRTAYHLKATPNPANSGFVDVQIEGNGPTPVTISSVISDGRLKGLLDSRDTTIPDLLDNLDTLASTLVIRVNQVHQAGFGLDGSTGSNFFTPTGLTAASISVALTDSRKVAASNSAGGLPGNNTNALALADLQNQTQAALGNTSFGDYYGGVAAGLGAMTQNADRDLQAQQIIDNQLQAHRAEVSGVSLDEELIKMLQYQRAFEAASRVIVTTDQVFQTILNLKQ